LAAYSMNPIVIIKNSETSIDFPSPRFETLISLPEDVFLPGNRYLAPQQ
jgi:hypothetical protein